MSDRCFGQVTHHSASGFICREKDFYAQFLESNVQRRAQGAEYRKQPKDRVIPPVVDGQERRMIVTKSMMRQRLGTSG